MGITFTRPQHITDTLQEIRSSQYQVLWNAQMNALEDYIVGLERENAALWRSKQTAWEVRDREERAFQQRLAELKATQVVKVVHGGRIS